MYNVPWILQNTVLLSEILVKDNNVSIAEDGASSSEIVFGKAVIFPSEFVGKAG